MPQHNIPLFKVFTAESVHAALKPVLESGRLASGPQVAAFEARIAAWLGAQRVVGLSDGSGALTVALYLAGVRPGDEVITSPLACSATLMPIANLFAKPVWCDVDAQTGMIDARKIDALITEKTRAVLVYHWAGNVADLAALRDITRRRDIKLIQDASEAFGAEFLNQHLGSEADFTVYSFYATKHISCGEGAALLAADSANLDAAIRIRRFGIDYSEMRLANGDLNPRFDIPLAGFNLAMNEIAATVGLENMRHADDIVSRCRENGRFFDNSLQDLPGIRLLSQMPQSVSGYWVYSLLAERRDALIGKLLAHGIGAQRLHLRNDKYTCFGGSPPDLPGVTAFDEHNLCIPCGWWVGAEERERIANCIRAGW
jgi:dTDP-4-amino-4,6-dideoxygalactose transaminase